MSKNCLNHFYTIFLFVLLAVTYSSICVGKSSEFIRDGGFELGIADVDIVRFPRYILNDKNKLTPPTRDSEKPISGHYSLRLPGLPTGGYRFIYRAVPLVSGKQYKLALDLRVTGATTVRVEAFTGWNRAGNKKINLKSGDHHIDLSFNAASKPLINANEVPVFVRIWVNSKNTVWLDNVSLRGSYGISGAPSKLHAWLEPDKNMAIYPVNGTGSFTFTAPGCKTCRVSYRISDPITGSTIATNTLKTETQNNILTANIPLTLVNRGFYWVYVQIYDQQNHQTGKVKRSYVVINPDPAHSRGYQRFGMAMEEHGKTSQIDASLSADEYYKLAQEIGVGTVRLFSLLMPDTISSDGVRFNFSEADAAIAIMEKYGIEPMIVLGSNSIHRIAPWLRDLKSSKNSIDLLKGLHTPADKKRYKRSEKYGQYLNLAKYKIYLESVFTHFNGKVKYYELWNEPGHKFLTEDFIRIAKITREIQQRVTPDSMLIGYSSTRRGQRGAGKNPDSLPEFLHEVQVADGIQEIDILSYHSEHAYLFMHKNPDHSNHETKYVPRLKTLLKRANKMNMPIWDTERGIPWKSPHEERLDYKTGTKHWEHERPSESVFDSARQLPMVYAAAFASNVKRLFWFYLESSSGTIHRVTRRWGFFDAQREPMPHIPIYDAMTETLQDATFRKLVESSNGGRAYIFQKPDGLVILAYNWKKNESVLHIRHQNDTQIKVLDIMGNPIRQTNIKGKPNEISIDSWPQYILLSSKNDTEVNFLSPLFK